MKQVWVMTQDENAIVLLKYCVKSVKTGDVDSYLIVTSEEILGRYETERRSQKVILDISRALRNLEVYEGEVIGPRDKFAILYKMPKE